VELFFYWRAHKNRGLKVGYGIKGILSIKTMTTESKFILSISIWIIININKYKTFGDWIFQDELRPLDLCTVNIEDISLSIYTRNVMLSKLHSSTKTEFCHMLMKPCISLILIWQIGTLSIPLVIAPSGFSNAYRHLFKSLTHNRTFYFYLIFDIIMWNVFILKLIVFQSVRLKSS
jgi:hypothetical protein